MCSRNYSETRGEEIIKAHGNVSRRKPGSTTERILDQRTDLEESRCRAGGQLPRSAQRRLSKAPLSREPAQGGHFI